MFVLFVFGTVLSYAFCVITCSMRLAVYDDDRNDDGDDDYDNGTVSYVTGHDDGHPDNDYQDEDDDGGTQ